MEIVENDEDEAFKSCDEDDVVNRRKKNSIKK